MTPCKAPGPGIPFEARGQLGFWKSFFETWRLASLEPKRFYPRVGETADNSSAIFFFVVVVAAAWALGLFLKGPLMLFVSISRLAFPREIRHLPFLHGPGFLIGSLVLVPMFYFVSLFLFSGITHLFLLLVKGGRLGFGATLRTMAYASAPFVIPIVGGLWSSILAVMGLAEAHRTELWRPVVALTLEMCLCGAAIVIPLALLLVALFRMAG